MQEEKRNGKNCVVSEPRYDLNWSALMQSMCHPQLIQKNLTFFSAWDELYEVFGDGRDYAWALAGDDEVDREEEQYKLDMKYDDVRFLYPMSLRF
jgi:hypothetical protein